MPPLLTPSDPPPFTLLNEDKGIPLFITCEHAGRALPKNLGLLGLEEDDFDQHYAYDPGVKAMTERLSHLMQAPALLGTYSRLVVDLNRRGDDTAFPTVGEGKIVPGNQNLTDLDKKARLDAIHKPYNDCFEDILDRHFLGRDIIPLAISIHSFTPVFHGQNRPWEIGAMWAQDNRHALPFIDFMRAKGYEVGDNEPYDMRIVRGAALDRHANKRRIPHIFIEYRNDLLRSESDINRHTDILAESLSAILERSDLLTLYEGPQRPYDPEAEKAYFENVMRTLDSSDGND